jgi:hypothetical protein
MPVKSSANKREILNQLINLFWTVLCFTPVLLFWIEKGVHLRFYIYLAVSLIMVLLPENTLDFFLISSNRKFYERLGVKQIRKFVQNGDLVKSMTHKQRHNIIKGAFQARKYLKTIAMYERYHWACFTFFLLTTVSCFLDGYLKLGFAITVSNVIYNIGSILLQQYNKIRIKRAF